MARKLSLSLSSSENKSPPKNCRWWWCVGSLSKSSDVKLFMYDDNDVIRKENYPEIFTLSLLLLLHFVWHFVVFFVFCVMGANFAFSSWIYLILILWLFSDHIQKKQQKEGESEVKSKTKMENGKKYAKQKEKWGKKIEGGLSWWWWWLGV